MQFTYRINPKKLNKEGQTTIMFDVAWHGQRLRMSARKQVFPQNFQPESKKLIYTAEPNSLALNWYLQQLQLDVEKLFLELERNRQHITEELFRERIEELLNVTRAAAKKSTAEKAVIKKTVWDYYEAWKQRYQTKYSPSYLRRFDVVKPWLEGGWTKSLGEVAGYHQGLLPEEINEDFVDGYLRYLLEDTPLVNNTVHIHVKFLRLALQQARLPDAWLKSDLANTPEGNQLTWDEVHQLYDYKFPADTLLPDVAKAFVFLCMTGLRFADYLRLCQNPTLVKDEQVDGAWIKTLPSFRTGKTGTRISLPLNKLAEDIWFFYKQKLPVFTNQEFNRDIKTVARRAGLNRLVKEELHKGRTVTEDWVPLHTLISAHMARHTAASLLLEASGDLTVAQHALGHTRQQTTGIYAQQKQKTSLRNTLDAWRQLEKTPKQK